jgi:hypothetical protein
VLKRTDNCWKQSARKEQGVERKKNTGKLRQQGNQPVSQQKRSQLPRLFFDNMLHGLQPKKHGHWKTAVHTTQHAWVCPFGFLFFCFLFFLSFYFPFLTFPFFYISNRTDNETETNRGRHRVKRVRAGRGVPRDRLGFVVFLETLTNPKQDIAAAVRRPKKRETRRRLGPAARRTERKAAERRKKQRKHNVSSNDQRTSTQIQQRKD